MKYPCALIALMCVSIVKLDSSHLKELLPDLHISDSEKIIADQMVDKIVSIASQNPVGLKMFVNLVVQILDNLTTAEMDILVKYMIEAVSAGHRAFHEPDGKEQLTFILSLAPRVVASLLETWSPEASADSSQAAGGGLEAISGGSSFGNLFADKIFSEFGSLSERISEVLKNEIFADTLLEMSKTVGKPKTTEPIEDESDLQPDLHVEL